jgi:hypothetical protein
MFRNIYIYGTRVINPIYTTITFSQQFSGRIKWLLSWTSEIPYLCEGRYDPQQNSNEVNEFVLKIEATVTRAINGQKVSAFAHTFVTSQSLNMGFSSASPATFYTDMPFETWVTILITVLIQQ